MCCHDTRTFNQTVEPRLAHKPFRALVIEHSDGQRLPLMEKVGDAVENDVYRKEILDMGKTIAEDLIDKGREEGEVRNQRRMLVRLLRNKFGKIPAAVVKRIEATERMDLLDTWFDLASA